MAELREEASTGTVSRAMHLLRVISEANGPITVKAASERLGLAPSTTHRLLQLLRQDGFVEVVAPGQYAVGPQLLRVSSLVVSSSLVVHRAQLAIEKTAAVFNETVMFGLYLPTEGALSFEGRADGQQRLTYQIDMHRPTSLVWGASGRSVLAFLDDKLIEELLEIEPPSPAGGEPCPDLDSLMLEVETIRTRGWATSHGQKLPDARGIASPIFGPSGVIGCICLTTPESRTDPARIESYGETVKEHAAALSHELGGRTQWQ